MDKTGSYRDMGMVQYGVNGSVEKIVLADGVELEGKILATEGQSLGHNTKPVVKVSDEQTIGANSTADKLKATSARIRSAKFEKIPVRSRGGMGQLVIIVRKILQELPVEYLMMVNLH
nr:hypothetical protein CFP56_49715 [Quercus suber]